MAFYTFQAKTNGAYVKAETLCPDLTLVDNSLYTIQVIGGAMQHYVDKRRR